MKKLLVLVSLILSQLAISGEIVSNRYMGGASSVPSFFQNLGGQDLLYSQYPDDSGKMRNDKVFYTVQHSYGSSFKSSDINFILDPKNGRLDDFYKDPTRLISRGAGLYDVEMEVDAIFTTMLIQGKMIYQFSKEGNKDIHLYRFHSFSMFFTHMTMKIEVENKGSNSYVRLYQIAAVKRTAFNKLADFENPIVSPTKKISKMINSTVSRLHDGIGGL